MKQHKILTFSSIYNNSPHIQLNYKFYIHTSMTTSVLFIYFKILNADLIFLFHGCLFKDHYSECLIQVELKNISTVKKSHQNKNIFYIFLNHFNLEQNSFHFYLVINNIEMNSLSIFLAQICNK